MNNTPKQKVYFTLSEVHEDLSLLKDDWFIIGSSALALSGIEIEVDDVDLLTSTADASFLKELWKEKAHQTYEPKLGEVFRSNFGRFQFSKMDVEVMGNLEVNKNGVWEKLVINAFEAVSIGDFSVKIPTKQEQKRIFEYFGREKDLKKATLIAQ